MVHCFIHKHTYINLETKKKTLAETSGHFPHVLFTDWPPERIIASHCGKINHKIYIAKSWNYNRAAEESISLPYRSKCCRNEPFPTQFELVPRFCEGSSWNCVSALSSLSLNFFMQLLMKWANSKLQRGIALNHRRLAQHWLTWRWHQDFSPRRDAVLFLILL